MTYLTKLLAYGSSATLMLMSYSVSAQMSVSCGDLYTARADYESANQEEMNYVSQRFWLEQDAYSQREACERNARTQEDHSSCFEEYQTTMDSIDDQESDLRLSRIAAQDRVDIIEMQLAGQGVYCP